MSKFLGIIVVVALLGFGGYFAYQQLSDAPADNTVEELPGDQSEDMDMASEESPESDSQASQEPPASEVVSPSQQPAPPPPQTNQAPPPPVDTGLPSEEKSGNDAPQIVIKNPGHGASVSDVLNIEAEVTNPSPTIGLGRVEFYVNGELVQKDTSAPFTATYNTLDRPNGPMTVSVTAYNNASGWSKKTISVTVRNKPSILLFGVQPSNVREGDEATVSWKSERANRCYGSGIWSGDKQLNGSERFVMYGSGKFIFTCVNEAGSDSRSAEVSVEPVPPSVSITAPASNSIVKNIVNISANAVDNTGIERVEFYIGDTFVGSDDTSPYSASYDTNQIKDLRYSVRAIAYDKGGNTDEDEISITTNNGNN